MGKILEKVLKRTQHSGWRSHSHTASVANLKSSGWFRWAYGSRVPY